MPTIQPGQIGFSNTKNKIFLSGLIRYFTKSPISHCFICYYPLQDMEMVFEANDMMMLTPFDRHYRNNWSQEYEIWEIKPALFKTSNISRSMALDNLQQTYLDYTNIRYGYTQLLWFIYRWIREVKWIEKIFGKIDLTKDRSWLSKGLLCSELLYLYLKSCKNQVLDMELAKFCANTIQPNDIRNIFLKYPSFFELKDKKGFE